MIPREILKKVRQIEITTSRLVTDVFAGQYHSVFKGQGVEFDEVREYAEGDDIRTIDWNVTARTGRAFVKKYVEERELTVMVMVDLSGSSYFGSVNQLKSKMAAEVSALLALAAIRNNDKVGLILFTDKIEKFIPPVKGLKNVLRIIREVLYFTPTSKGTDIPAALEYLNKVMTRKAITFLISDFMATNDDNLQNLKKALNITNRKHDLISIRIKDKLEYELKDAGIVCFKDSELNDVLYIDTSNKDFRNKYLRHNVKREELISEMFKRNGIDFINISTDKSYLDEIVKFFLGRRKKARR